MILSESTRSFVKGVIYFSIGLGIGGIFHQLIISGWHSSLQQSRWLVQKQWAESEENWLALDEIGRRLVNARPRSPEGWDALITSSLARGDRAQAIRIIKWLQQDFPAHNSLWNEWETVINQGDWKPKTSSKKNTLPVLGDPLVRAEGYLLNCPSEGCVKITFDRPVKTFRLIKAASYLDETTGTNISAKLSEPECNFDIDKETLSVTYCPSVPLVTSSRNRFVFDLPQTRVGGAWLAYPVVVEITQTDTPESKPAQEFLPQ